MIIGNVLDWAVLVLQETESGLTAEALAECLRGQFDDMVNKLETLLSLDQRFVREEDGSWQLSPVYGTEGSVADLVNQALALRERAVRALLKERKVLEDEVTEVRRQLREVDDRLTRLGHEPVSVSADARKHSGQFSLEYHLDGLPQRTRQLALQLHEAILGLPDANPKLNKYHIAYSTNRRFAMLVLRKSKVVIFVRADAGFKDPAGWTRDTTRRRLGLERTFDLASLEDLGYAMRLIEQSYDIISKGDG